jgi:hypothetical protein
LDLLWFDGGMRWPRAQPFVQVRVCGGRVLIKAQKLHAIDVYTGRLLWETVWPFTHSPGDQLVAAEDGIDVRPSTEGKTARWSSPLNVSIRLTATSSVGRWRSSARTS